MKMTEMNRLSSNSLFEWVRLSSDRIYRFVIYRRIYTPYEQSEKFMDESVYEDGGNWKFGKIAEAVNIGNDYLLGFRMYYVDMDDGESEDLNRIEYVKLSEIRLELFDCDQVGGM